MKYRAQIMQKNYTQQNLTWLSYICISYRCEVEKSNIWLFLFKAIHDQKSKKKKLTPSTCTHISLWYLLWPTPNAIYAMKMVQFPIPESPNMISCLKHAADHLYEQNNNMYRIYWSEFLMGVSHCQHQHWGGGGGGTSSEWGQKLGLHVKREVLKTR